MTKLIKFNTPAMGGSIVEKEGYVCILKVGDTRHKFVLQIDLLQPSILTDYRSGYRLTNLAGLALAQYVSRPYGYVHGIAGWRKRAQGWLNERVAERGTQGVLDMLRSVPTLN